MQTLQKGYRGLGLLVELNRDPALVLLALTGALLLGAYLGTP